MRKIKTLILIVCSAYGILSSQELTRNGFAIGYQINQYQKDFGMGLNILSPYFASESVALHLRGNFMFNEHIKNSETVWTPYQNVSLGMTALGGWVGEKIRLYAEGGCIALFPGSSFSSKSLELGGYGLFGFEFFMNPAMNYHIEIGGVGNGAVADKIPNKPIYSNGLLINVGYRYTFK